MTETKFMEENKISKKQMKSWKEKNWIRGAHYLEDGTYYIPEGAIKPYSKRNRKLKDGIGMYSSLINGISQGLDVFPELYGMHPDRFLVFINALIELKFITTIEIDGITYYTALPKCKECGVLSTSKTRKFIKASLDTLSPAIEATSKGITSAVLNKAS